MKKKILPLAAIFGVLLISGCIDGTAPQPVPAPGVGIPAWESPEDDGNLAWFTMELFTGAFCRYTEKDGPFYDYHASLHQMFDSKEECLSAIPSGCYIEKQVYNRNQTVVMVVGSSVVCNIDRHYHECTSEGWIIDVDSAVRTTGPSYCPGELSNI